MVWFNTAKRKRTFKNQWMKKTAMQLLIDKWEESKPKGPHGLIWQVFIDEATELLEKEREQIEEAHYEGGYYTNGSVHEAKQYYKETYEQ